jgi:hypothetical protein
MQVGFIGLRTGYRVMVIKFQVPQNVGNFLISSANINFSRTLLCGVSYKLGDLFYGHMQHYAVMFPAVHWIPVLTTVNLQVATFLEFVT